MATTLAHKGSLSDLRHSTLLSQLIDYDDYRADVLQLPPNVTEDEIDEKLAQEAAHLHLILPPASPEIDRIASSLSATTIASDTNHRGSILSQSTAPTSCSSSERKPTTEPATVEHSFPPDPSTPSILSANERRRSSGFRSGIRKMAAFRKRRSLAGTSSSTLTSISSDLASTVGSDNHSVKSDRRGAPSVKSDKSSWSNAPSSAKQAYDVLVPEDEDAMRRSMESKELLAVHAVHVEEKIRFLDFQRATLSRLRSHHQKAKQLMMEKQQVIIKEAQEKNEIAIEELEARQLEGEVKLIKEFEVEKRVVLVRLRYMEAYCQNPTPPPTPNDSDSIRLSQDGQKLERKVTDRDYHNLAQQYRERDVMDSLHASKINVLRGKQKKLVEGLTQKMEKEIEAIEGEHEQEIEALDGEWMREESLVKGEFGQRKAKLEARWRLQALIERSKLEKNTGLKYAALPGVLAVENLLQADSQV